MARESDPAEANALWQFRNGCAILGTGARVAGATYLGSRMEYEVALGGTELLVSRPISEPRLEAGQTVALRIDTGGVTRLS